MGAEVLCAVQPLSRRELGIVFIVMAPFAPCKSRSRDPCWSSEVFHLLIKPGQYTPMGSLSPQGWVWRGVTILPSPGATSEERGRAGAEGSSTAFEGEAGVGSGSGEAVCSGSAAGGEG